MSGPLTPAQIKQVEREKRKADSDRRKLLLQSTQKAKSITAKMAGVQPILRPDVQVSDEEVEPLKAKAESGDAAAMVRLGHYYMMHIVPGFGNEATAATWFRKAADTGDADALAWLALYDRLTKPKQNKADIQQRFQAAAEKGSMLGEYLMGLTTENYADKIPWFEKAANRGFVPAMRALAEAIAEHTYREIAPLRNYNLTPEAQAWAKIAAANDDHKAFGILATEGAHFSGSESERPNIDFKKLDSYAQKHIELAKKLSYTWYGSVFDSRLMPGRYDWGGPKADALLSAYAEGASLLHRQNKNDASFLRKFCADMTKMADAGDRDAMLVIVKAAKNWKFFFPLTKTPCPFKPGPYESKLKEMAKNDPLIPRLLAN